MDRIIAGRFQNRKTADMAVATMGGYVPRNDARIYHHHPPGWRDAMPAHGVEAMAVAAVESSLGIALAGGLAAGFILAVRVAFAGDEQRVIDDLRRSGARDIERATGLWDDGEQPGFNPPAAKRMVAPAAGG